ncbi:MAG: hypothetical protein ACNYPG_05905 [Candidatus Porifericomitaceae bacterium WSBS_2022_MAG_OTU9]
MPVPDDVILSGEVKVAPDSNAALAATLPVISVPDLFMHDNRGYAILNIVAQVFMCLSACAVGYAVAKTA